MFFIRRLMSRFVMGKPVVDKTPKMTFYTSDFRPYVYFIERSNACFEIIPTCIKGIYCPECDEEHKKCI